MLSPHFQNRHRRPEAFEGEEAERSAQRTMDANDFRKKFMGHYSDQYDEGARVAIEAKAKSRKRMLLNLEEAIEEEGLARVLLRLIDDPIGTRLEMKKPR